MFSAGKAGQDEESVSFERNISHVELHESSYLDTWTASSGHHILYLRLYGISKM